MSSENIKNTKEFDVIVAQILDKLADKLGKTSEISKREAKPFSWLYSLRGFKVYLKNYKKTNRDLNRKKEKAFIFALHEIASSIRLEKDNENKDSKKLENMFKRGFK